MQSDDRMDVHMMDAQPPYAMMMDLPSFNGADVYNV